MDDREQIRLCRDGHPEVFREIVSRYGAGVVAFLAGRLGDRDKAEEAAQETFVRAFFSLGRLEKPEALFSWLLGIARRVALEQQRSEQRQQRAAAERARLTPDPPTPSDLPLERTIGELAEPYQEVLLLRYYAGLSCGEVAQRLDLPLGTVTKRLSRAYEMLRERLRKLDTRPEVQP